MKLRIITAPEDCHNLEDATDQFTLVLPSDRCIETVAGENEPAEGQEVTIENGEDDDIFFLEEIGFAVEKVPDPS